MTNYFTKFCSVSLEIIEMLMLRFDPVCVMKLELMIMTTVR